MQDTQLEEAGQAKKSEKPENLEKTRKSVVSWRKMKTEFQE